MAKQDGPLRLVGVIRVSTAEQASDQRAGLARQRESIERIANSLDATMELVSLSDVGGSDLAATPEWRDRIVPRLKSGAHLAVDAIDRLIRPDGFDFTVLATVKALGCRIYTPGGEVDVSRPEGFLLGGIGALFGGVEKINFKRRVHDAKEAKRRRGEFTQADICLPRGITYDRKARRWGYTSDKSKVETAFRMFVIDGVTPAEIAKHIGVTLTGLKVILRNTIYKGVASYVERRTGDAYASKIPGRQAEKRRVKRAPDEIIRARVFGGDGQEPQLIDDVTFERTQVLLRERRDAHRQRRARSQPRTYYSGYLVSSESGHVVYGKTSNTRRDYFVCSCRDTSNSRCPRPGCKLPSLPLDDTTKAIDRLFTNQIFSYALVMALLNKDKKRDKEDIADLRRQQTAIATKLEKLVDLFMADRVDRKVYDRKYEQLQAEARALQVRMDAATATAVSDDLDATVREHLKGSAFDPAWSPEQKRVWLAKWVAAIHVSAKGVELVKIRLPHSTCDVKPAGWTWVKLLGYDPFDTATIRQAKLEAAGLYSAGQVAERIGVKPAALRYMVSSGKIPEPAMKRGGKRFWTDTELAALVKSRRKAA